MENVAIIGSNFGIKGYLPALKKNKSYKISLICCKSKNFKKKNENNIFKNNK